MKLAPAQQGFLTTVGHPGLGRVHLLDCVREFLPVGMVGDDERQFDTALPGALAHTHPARGHGSDRFGQAAAPAVACWMLPATKPSTVARAS